MFLVLSGNITAHVDTLLSFVTGRDESKSCVGKTSYTLKDYLQNILVHQRRSEDYTGMQRGQARFFTYYRFLALRRHCSVGFRCRNTSRFREIQKRFYRKKIAKWWTFALCMERKPRASVLFVHCVSKQPLILIPEGSPCDELECRMFIVFNMRIVWRIVLCPAVVNGIKIDEIVRWLG
jgi:hypothetical protein